MFLKLDVVHESHEKSANESQKYLDSIETRTAMCSLFEMKGGSAMDTHALYLKHVSSIGCPDWNVCTFAPAGATICITFFLGSDGGPDEVGAKMQAMYESIPDPPSVARFVFSNQCLLHIYHLIFKKSLSTGDSLSHLEEIPNCRPTLFLQFGENTSHVERHIEEDETRVDSQIRPAGCQSGLHWPVSHRDERQMVCN